VKLREGRLDIKAMVSAPRPLSREFGVTGRTDQWAKWSFARGKLKTLSPALHQSGHWLKVWKERSLRKFSADMGGLVEVTGRQAPFPAGGCNGELTRIAVEANPRFWFSLAFEAFAAPVGADQDLFEKLSGGNDPGNDFADRPTRGCGSASDWPEI